MSSTHTSMSMAAGALPESIPLPRGSRFPGVTLTGLFFCIGGAVLMFGGVEPRALTAIQTVLFILAVWSLWSPAGLVLLRYMPWQGPALLLGLVGLQALFLPELNQFFGGQVLRLAMYICVFLLVATLGRNPLYRQRFVLLLVWVSLLEATYGLVVFFVGIEKVLHIDKFAYLTRASGTYVNPNHFAGLMGLVIPLAMGGLLYKMDKLRRERDPVRMNEFFWSAVFYMVSGLLMFTAVVVSQSRMGLISISVAVLATGLLSLAASWNRRGAVFTLTLFILLSLVAGLWIGVEPIASRYEILEESYEGRKSIWMDTVEMIGNHPLLGSGLGSFRVEYTKYQRVYLEYLVDHAHNDYLQVAAELGIPGALLLFGLFLWTLGRGVRLIRRQDRPADWILVSGYCGSITAILVHSVADFNLQIPANAMVLAGVLGLLHSAVVSPDRGSADSRGSLVPEQVRREAGARSS